jgi:hypothetical protein
MSTPEATDRARVHAERAEELLAQLEAKRLKADFITMLATHATAHATLALYYQRVG